MEIINILFVDDDSACRSVINFLLEKLEFKVDTASYPLTALKKLKENHYDLIITDLYFPGDMSGGEFIHEVRISNTNIPIAVCAAASICYEGNIAIFKSTDYEIHIERNLFNSFLSKPFSMKDLTYLLHFN